MLSVQEFLQAMSRPAVEQEGEAGAEGGVEPKTPVKSTPRYENALLNNISGVPWAEMRSMLHRTISRTVPKTVATVIAPDSSGGKVEV